MLIGSFYHSLQGKGRLAIPARFRTSLGEQPILTRGLEPCLQLLPFDIWSKLTQSLGSHPLESTASRKLRRLIAHQASPIEFDSQGRILIPKTLRGLVGLEKKVVIAGSIDWVEIWDRDTYHSHLETINQESQSLVENHQSSNHE